MMLCPSRSFRTCCCTSAGVPSRKSLANTREGRLSAGIITPPRVYERLGVPVPSTSDGNRVCRPIFSAANWSSETVFLKPPRPGNRAAVNQLISEVWPLAPV